LTNSGGELKIQRRNRRWGLQKQDRRPNGNWRPGTPGRIWARSRCLSGKTRAPRTKRQRCGKINRRKSQRREDRGAVTAQPKPAAKISGRIDAEQIMGSGPKICRRTERDHWPALTCTRAENLLESKVRAKMNSRPRKNENWPAAWLGA
jgi:hypothetical protein